MPERVCLFHWNEREAEERAGALRNAGYVVTVESRFEPALLRALAETPPDAFVVDLTRLPSQGRDVALALRSRAGTRRVPLVVAGGEDAAVDRLRKLLPDAEYAAWGRLRFRLKRAIANPPKQPVRPDSVLAGYSGTPLPRKLGIKPGSSVALIDAPADFPQTLGDLPDGARLRSGTRGVSDLAVWFVRSAADLNRRLPRLSEALGDIPIWIAWPKKASGVESDLSDSVVRETGLARGLVDYKVCAIDPTWSGLLFRRRK